MTGCKEIRRQLATSASKICNWILFSFRMLHQLKNMTSRMRYCYDSCEWLNQREMWTLSVVA
jgi:hypothetical protein